jgi:hypothetical protein
MDASLIPVSTSQTRTSVSELIPLQEASRLLPKSLHVATLYRWASRGVRGVRLRTLCVGRARCTTEQWLAEFFEQITPTGNSSLGIASSHSRLTRHAAKSRREAQAILMHRRSA